MTEEIDMPPRWDQSRAKCGKRFPDIGKDGRQIIPARFSVTYQKY